jgi:hypothetical protein
MLAGKCLCGAICGGGRIRLRHELTLLELPAGDGFGLQAVRAGIERDELDIANGEDNLMIFGDETGNDTRCKVCGSFLYSVVRDGSTSPWESSSTIRPSAGPSTSRRVLGAVIHNH